MLNAAVVVRDGAVVGEYAKMLLPTYDVFDETRYFEPGSEVCVVRVPTASGERSVGLTICEDLWHDEQFGGHVVYGVDPIARTVAAGAEVIVNISGSPFRVGVQRQRETLFSKQAKTHSVPFVYVNQAAANDDLVFDGASLVLDRS